MERPDLPEQLDRPYGDQETDYLTLQPEGPRPEGGEPTGDLVVDEERAAAAAVSYTHLTLPTTPYV